MLSEELLHEDSDDPETRAMLGLSANLLVLAAAVRERAEAKQNQHHVQLLNLAQFAVLWNMDLRCLMEEAEGRKYGWKKKIFARQLAVTMYEAMDDFTHLLGGEFRNWARGRTDWEEVERNLNPLHKKLVEIQNRHANVLRTIRNVAAAHRDHDAGRQLQVLERMSSNAVVGFAYELLTWTNDLLSFVGGLVTTAMTSDASVSPGDNV